jgi:hypothetical protein
VGKPLAARAGLQISEHYPAKVALRIKVSERVADDPPVSLTPVNGKNGIATATCGGPNSIANISFEQRLSEAQRRHLSAT